MFAMPAAVYKGGQLVAENGHTRATPTGRQLRAIAAHDAFISELNG
jgi:hypothetical protein